MQRDRQVVRNAVQIAKKKGRARRGAAGPRTEKHALPRRHKASFEPGGSITFVSAGNARVAMPGTAGLATINGEIEAAVRMLAKELAPTRISSV